jgi:D-alanine-D-alanine ligase
MKKNILVFFGGRSSEHDVSIITGVQVMDNLDKQKYNVIPVYISREGEWFTGEKLKDTAYFRNFDKNAKGVIRVFMNADSTDSVLYESGKKPAPYFKPDVVIPAMHGLHGEDGTLQALFELKDIPYTSAGVTGSAVGMDKIVMKAVFKGCGFPVLDSVYFERQEWAEKSEAIIAKVEAAFAYPVFVKPANLGSSIGISKAADSAGLRAAIDIAVHYDRRVLVEPAVVNLKEVNCSVAGFGADAKTSVLEEPVAWQQFLTFEEKYLRGGQSKGMKSLTRRIPADIPDDKKKEVEALSLEVFRILDLKGVVRIDYLYDTVLEKVYVNEVNTIPGSFAFYLWEPRGVPFTALLDELIAYAERQMQEKHACSFAYDSQILNKVRLGGKMGK